MKTILTWLLLVAYHIPYGQVNSLTGLIYDCKDKIPLILAPVQLMKENKIFQSTYSDVNGIFKFDSLSSGKYTIKVSYFYFPTLTQDLVISKNDSIKTCISEGNSDSLLNDISKNPVLTLYNFRIFGLGAPIYTDQQVNSVALKYGVVYKNLGCIFDEKFNKYTLTVHRVLAAKYGKDWEKRMWAEIKHRYSKK